MMRALLFLRAYFPEKPFRRPVFRVIGGSTKRFFQLFGCAFLLSSCSLWSRAPEEPTHTLHPSALESPAVPNVISTNVYAAQEPSHAAQAGKLAPLDIRVAQAFFEEDQLKEKVKS